MKCTATIGALILAVAGTAATADHTPRQLIVGGTTVPRTTALYVAGVRTNKTGSNFCSGALIEKKYVLTAALCTLDFRGPGTLYVSLGSHSVAGSDDGQQIKVVAAFNHSSFDYQSGIYNFALLELETASSFAPIQLPQPNAAYLPAGTPLTVFGWGNRKVNGSLNQEMQSAVLPVTSYENCSYGFDGLDKTFFCAGGDTNRGTCEDDDGSALVQLNGEGDQNDVLIGTSAYSVQCDEFNTPSIFSNVTIALPWINSIISGGASHCVG